MKQFVGFRDVNGNLIRPRDPRPDDVEIVASSGEADQESLVLSEYARDGLGDLVTRLEACIEELKRKISDLEEALFWAEYDAEELANDC